MLVADPRYLFVSPSTSLRYVRKEGEDLTLPCLLTDPDATDFIFRMDNGSAVPYGMNVTFDPKKGVLIRNVQPGFNADYVCSARIRGVEKVSKIFSINVIQREFRWNPSVLMNQRIKAPDWNILEFCDFTNCSKDKHCRISNSWNHKISKCSSLLFCWKNNVQQAKLELMKAKMSK